MTFINHKTLNSTLINYFKVLKNVITLFRNRNCLHCRFWHTQKYIRAEFEQFFGHTRLVLFTYEKQSQTAEAII